MNKEIKKLMLLLVGIIIFIIFLDLVNITRYIPFSKNYDWLGVYSALIGGILGAVATLYGISKTIKYEKEKDKKQEIENRKNNFYSYLTFSKQPAKITISLDSIPCIKNINNQIMLIGEDVETDTANYFDIELDFELMNNIFPSAVSLNKLTILYNDKTQDNQVYFEDIECFYKYNSGYNKITIKNEKTVAFVAKCLLTKEKKDKLSKILKESSQINIIAEACFLNPSKIITKGKFTSDLKIINIEKLGNSNNIGSNKLQIDFFSLNNYFIVEDIYHIDEEKK